MTRLDAITDAYLFITGKTTPPATGEAKRNQLTALVRKFYRDWQREPKVEWLSLYGVIGAGTVTATDTFDLDTEVNGLSQREGNSVRVLLSSGTYIDYQTVKPQQLYQYRNSNAVALVNNTTLQFSKAFTSTDQAFGGTIQVPAILKLDDLDRDNDDVLIDNPQWLPVRVAAQYVFTDSQLNYLYDGFIEQADEIMQAMIASNGSVSDSINTGVDYFATMGNVT